MPHKFRPSRQNSHLARLESIYAPIPIYFITTCTSKRRQSLISHSVFEILVKVFSNCEAQYDWHVGRFVMMPDHVHFFCSPKDESKSLELFVGKWKEWTSKYMTRRLAIQQPIWQKEFHDHLLRNDESYEDKWYYVRENPVRAGLVEKWQDWEFAGELNQLEF